MSRVAVHFEAAAEIISLTLLGQVPKTARCIRADGTEEGVPLTHVHVGDLLRVRPGEKVPVSKRVGDKVIGATLNTSGALVVRSERVGASTVLSANGK